MGNTKHTSYAGYGFVAILLLVILTGAILTPDYLNYKYKLEHLKTTQTVSIPTASQANAPAAPPLTTTDTKNLAKTEASKEEVETKALSTSDIFETYGKLITMLLGFVSAIGVLVGYFIKTSIRDLIEDARSDHEREVTIFKSDKDRILDEIKATKAQTDDALRKTLKIQREYEQKVKEAKALLDALEVAAKTYSSTSPQAKEDPATTAAKVDSEL